MMNPQVHEQELIFSTIAITADSSPEEFVVELFDYSPELTCDGVPKKVIKNFDELIDFFESID